MIAAYGVYEDIIGITRTMDYLLHRNRGFGELRRHPWVYGRFCYIRFPALYSPTSARVYFLQGMAWCCGVLRGFATSYFGCIIVRAVKRLGFFRSYEELQDQELVSNSKRSVISNVLPFCERHIEYADREYTAITLMLTLVGFDNDAIRVWQYQTLDIIFLA